MTAAASPGVSCVQARIVRLQAISAGVREIVLEPESGVAPLRAGQHVQIHVPAFAIDRVALAEPSAPALPEPLARLPARIAYGAPCVRAYSPALPSNACDGRWPLLVRLALADRPCNGVGQGSAYLFSRCIGDSVTCSPPAGTFGLRPGSREKIFVGGGTGIAPLRAMLWERLQQDAVEPIHLWLGARSEDEVPYLLELILLCDSAPQLTFHLVYSQADNGEQGPRWVHEAVYEGLLHSHGALAECEFYLCGPPAMISAMRDLLAQIGIDSERIAYEPFA